MSRKNKPIGRKTTIRKSSKTRKSSSKKKPTKSNDGEVKKAIKKINVLILGPGYPKQELDRRIKIKQELKKFGINAHVMEEKKAAARQITHVDKFDELLKMDNLLCIAISTKDGYSLGLTFEIGFICGSFGLDKAGKKRLEEELGFLIDKKADKKKILSSYITTGLFVNGIKKQYTYPNNGELLKMINTWTKIRARDLGLF